MGEPTRRPRNVKSEYKDALTLMTEQIEREQVKKEQENNQEKSYSEYVDDNN